MNRPLVDLLFLLPVLLLSMMAHEVAHGFIAFKMGDPTAKHYGRLTANPLSHLDPVGTAMFVITYLFGGFIFGWAKPVPVNPYYFRNRQTGMAIVGLAGPVTNFLIAVVLGVVLNFIHPPVTSLFFRIMFMAFQVNIVLGVFNLIPLPPLDGSRVIGAFMPRDMYARWVALDRYGIVFILLIFIVFRGPFLTVLGWAYGGISRLLLPYYFGG
ncbi:MAG: site-2 protease family protein [Actinobacteria bacterium]|nr:site-2 protease family protein [Actinomycetota bacterium]